MLRRAGRADCRRYLVSLCGGILLFATSGMPAVRAHAEQEPAIPARQKVERLLERINSKDVAVRLATVNMLGDRGQLPLTDEERATLENADAVGVAIQAWLRENASGELAKRASRDTEPDPQVRRAALVSLGRVRAKPESAVAAWRPALKDPDRATRLAVVQALLAYVTRSTEIKKMFGVREAEKEDKLQKMADQVSDAAALSKLFGDALRDADPEVQSGALRAVLRMLKDLSVMESPLPDVGGGSMQSATLREKLPQLAKGLESLTGDLEKVLSDATPAQQSLALDILRQIADWRDPRPGAVVVIKGEAPKPRGRLAEADLGAAGAEAAKILGDAQIKALPAVAAKIAAPEPEIRLAALALIEQLGIDAKTAVPAVADALHDRNRFVRWAAARSLGRIGATNYQPAIDGLAELMADDDLDVAIAAALALEEYGEGALQAIPALAKALEREDPELRRGIMFALKKIGPRGTAAIEPLTALLKAREAEVRREVPPLLEMYGSAAMAAVPALQAALQDPDAEVRQRTGEALLKIVGK